MLQEEQEHEAENNEQSGCRPCPMPTAFISIIESKGKCAEGNRDDSTWKTEGAVTHTLILWQLNYLDLSLKNDLSA